MLINAGKHGFPDGRSGRIKVSYLVGEEFSTIAVTDNGVGMGPNALAGDTLGLRLVKSLANQLQGELEFSTGESTCVRFRFPS